MPEALVWDDRSAAASTAAGDANTRAAASDASTRAADPSANGKAQPNGGAGVCPDGGTGHNVLARAPAAALPTLSTHSWPRSAYLITTCCYFRSSSYSVGLVVVVVSITVIVCQAAQYITIIIAVLSLASCNQPYQK